MDLQKQSILVISPQFVGDCMLSMPFFKNLRKSFPDAQIDAITKNAGIEVLKPCPYIDTVYDLQALDLRLLKKQNYQKAYIIKRSFSSAWLAFRLGIKDRIGFSGQFRDFLLTNPVFYRKNGKHEMDCFLDVLRADYLEITEYEPEYFVSEDEKASVSQKLAQGKKALIVGCASTPVKQWREDYFRDIIDFLVEKGYKIYFAGVKSERRYYNEITYGRPFASNTVNLCGELSLAQTVALISEMDLVFGIDSGFCHTASILGRKTLAMYGCMSLSQWKLVGKNSISLSLKLPCSPCNSPETCKKDYACMQGITPDLVIEKLEKLM